MLVQPLIITHAQFPGSDHGNQIIDVVNAFIEQMAIYFPHVINFINPKIFIRLKLIVCSFLFPHNAKLQLNDVSNTFIVLNGWTHL